MVRRFILAAIVIILATLCLGAESPRLKISLGFSGQFTGYGWTPLWVEADGAIPSGRFEIRRETEKGETISTESYDYFSGIRCEFPVLLSNDVGSVVVGLYSENSLLSETSFKPKEKAFPGQMVLCVGLRSQALQAIEQALLPRFLLRAVPIGIEELPSLLLDLDGVSAIVMSDPGPSLSPSQVAALQSWISGGGRMLVAGFLSADKSLLSSLGLLPKTTDGGQIELGRGSLRYLRAKASELPTEPEWWKETIPLIPDDNTKRLSASALTADDSIPEAPEGNSFALAGLCVSIWLVAGIYAIFAKRRKYLLLSLWVLLSSISSVFVAPVLGSLWQGGLVSRIRLLAIPGGAGAYVDVLLQPQKTSAFFAPAERNARQIRVSFVESEFGVLGQGFNSAWRHTNWKPYFCVRESGGANLNLVASLSPAVLEGSGIPELALSSSLAPTQKAAQIQGDFAYYSTDSKAWFGWGRESGWQQLKSAPAWISGEQNWIEQLRELLPGFSFYVGHSILPELALGVQGKDSHFCYWVLPIQWAQKVGPK